MNKQAFIVKTYTYFSDYLREMEKDLCNNHKDYNLVTIEPQETFVLIIWEIKERKGKKKRHTSR